MAPSMPDLSVDRKELPEQADQAYFMVERMAVEVQDQPPATGLYVKGKVANRMFVAEGDIEGEGQVGAAGGSPGWVELADQSFHGAQTGRPPFPPYVEGLLTKDGTFSPGSRTVHR